MRPYRLTPASKLVKAHPGRFVPVLDADRIRAGDYVRLDNRGVRGWVRVTTVSIIDGKRTLVGRAKRPSKFGGKRFVRFDTSHVLAWKVGKERAERNLLGWSLAIGGALLLANLLAPAPLTLGRR